MYSRQVVMNNGNTGGLVLRLYLKNAHCAGVLSPLQKHCVKGMCQISRCYLTYEMNRIPLKEATIVSLGLTGLNKAFSTELTQNIRFSQHGMTNAAWPFQ